MRLHELLKDLETASQNEFVEINNDQLEEIHSRLLEFVRDFAEFCSDHGIEWCLTAGNMLGAVRHNGFIPWDDDIDVTMTRENYIKLARIFPETYKGKYYLVKPGDQGYIFHFPRIYVKDTLFRSILSSDECPNGLYIDIFVDDNLSDNGGFRLMHGVLCTLLLGICSAVRVYQCRKTLMANALGSKQLIKEIYKRMIPGRVLSIVPMEKWMKLADRCFSLCRNNKTENIVIPSGAKHFFGEIFNRKKFCNYKLSPFENLLLPIPEDPDYYLRLRYGNDYMNPPKEDSRERRRLIEYKL